MMKAILANSDGCRENPGRRIQRDDPPALPPIPGSRTSPRSTRQIIRIGTAAFFQKW